MFHLLKLARFTLVIGFILSTPAVAQQAYLEHGSFALNPDDGQTVFLYVPGLTLLYDLKKSRTIGSRTMGSTDYWEATTQDGIRVLVRKKDFKVGTDVFEDDHFVVHRRMPLCVTKTSNLCNNGMWSGNIKPDRISLWRTHGKFATFVDNDNENLCTIPNEDWPKVRDVLVDDGNGKFTRKEGFISRKSDRSGLDENSRLELDEAGFITLWKCHQSPVYSFERIGEYTIDPCNQEIKYHGSMEGSLYHGGITSFFKIVGKFLGRMKPPSPLYVLYEVYDRINPPPSRSRKNRESQIKIYYIERRPFDFPGRLPFGIAIVQKAFQCQNGQSPKEMKDAEFIYIEFSPVDDDDPIIKPIITKADDIKVLNLPNDNPDRGLVSINEQCDHFELLDLFLKRGIPKSVANFFIKEINAAKPIPTEENRVC